MKLTAARIRFGANDNLPPIGKIVGLLIGLILILFLALIFGGVAAYFPATFTVQLIMLMGGVVVFFAAMLVPSDADVPFTLMRRLLFTLLIIWVVWPESISYYGLPGPNINPIRLIYWVLAAIWFFWFVVSRDLRSQLFDRVALIKPFGILLIAYLGWGFVCAFASVDPFFSLHYFIKLMIGPVLIFIFSLSCLRDRRDVDFAFLLMVIAALIACAVGYVEMAKGKNLFYGFVPDLVQTGDKKILYLVDKVTNSKLLAESSNRLWSTFSNPLTFGEYLALSFPLAVFLVGYASKPWWRAIGLIALPAIIGILVYSQARSALLATGLVVACLVVAFGVRAMRQKRSFGLSIAGAFSIIVLGFAIIGTAGVAVEMVAGRSALESGSSFARVIMLERGITLTLNSPILGYGPGLGASTIGFLPGFHQLTIDSHYLSVVLETGLPGLMLFLGLLGYPILKGVFVSLKATDRNSARIVVIFSALLGFSVIKSVLSLTDNFGAVFLLIALLAIALEAEKNPHQAIKS